MRFVAMMVLAGCGRVDFDPRIADTMVTCDAWGPFGAPVRLADAVQSPVDDWGAAAAGDGLELVFYSFRTGSIGDADVYDSVRPSIQDPWPAATAIAAIETAGREADPSMTADRLELIYSETNGSGDRKLFVATRTSVTAAFGAPKPLGGVDAVRVSFGPQEYEPFVTADGLRLVYRSDNGSTGTLLEAARADRASTFKVVGPLFANLPGDRQPTLSSDGLELFFQSDERGGAGGFDLFTTRRPTVDQPFGPIEPVTELASPKDEAIPRLSADGSMLYLAYATLSAGGTNADLMVATRSCR